MVHAPADQVFAYLDDPKSLSTHMDEPSMMMMGSRMSVDVDADGGQAIGSKIRMHGRMMGLRLSLEEVVIERQVPVTKLWETTGTPKLIVIEHYRMGFELTPNDGKVRVRFFIDYSLPPRNPGYWFGPSQQAPTPTGERTNAR